MYQDVTVQKLAGVKFARHLPPRPRSPLRGELPLAGGNARRRLPRSVADRGLGGEVMREKRKYVLSSAPHGEGLGGGCFKNVAVGRLRLADFDGFIRDGDVSARRAMELHVHDHLHDAHDRQRQRDQHRIEVAHQPNGEDDQHAADA